MKRYMLFAGDDYYPNGGIHDFISSFDNYDEAVRYAKLIEYFNMYEWAHVYDIKESRVLFDNWKD